MWSITAFSIEPGRSWGSRNSLSRLATRAHSDQRIQNHFDRILSAGSELKSQARFGKRQTMGHHVGHPNFVITDQLQRLFQIVAAAGVGSHDGNLVAPEIEKRYRRIHARRRRRKK